MAISIPLDDRALHVVIDMQTLFAPPGVWGLDGIHALSRPIGRIIAAKPDKTVFTRFVTPTHAGEANGCWRGYYEHWTDVTQAHLPPDGLDVLPELQRLAPDAAILDKTTHSAFESGDLADHVKASGATTLVLTGIETDVCVLGTALSAIDRGYHVIIVSDAVASSSPPAHQATLDHVLPRFDQQLEILDTATLLERWAG